jgi:hypothetical protein
MKLNQKQKKLIETLLKECDYDLFAPNIHNDIENFFEKQKDKWKSEIRKVAHKQFIDAAKAYYYHEFEQGSASIWLDSDNKKIKMGINVQNEFEESFFYKLKGGEYTLAFNGDLIEGKLEDFIDWEKVKLCKK